MPQLLAIDHIAITVRDLEATCAFYDRLFGTRVVRDYAPEGRPAFRVIIVGGHAKLSVHQEGNGLDPVADRPTPGSGDICFRWGGAIDEAIAHLGSQGIEIVEGPSRRRTVDGLPAHSIYFRDPDRNLIELMAAD
jgi:catechol 2,3-dioxygenase-like lactoylglutathione lyase family enzyme